DHFDPVQFVLEWCGAASFIPASRQIYSGGSALPAKTNATRQNHFYRTPRVGLCLTHHVADRSSALTSASLRSPSPRRASCTRTRKQTPAAKPIITGANQWHRK